MYSSDDDEDDSDENDVEDEEEGGEEEVEDDSENGIEIDGVVTTARESGVEDIPAVKGERVTIPGAPTPTIADGKVKAMSAPAVSGGVPPSARNSLGHDSYAIAHRPPTPIKESNGIDETTTPDGNSAQVAHKKSCFGFNLSTKERKEQTTTEKQKNKKTKNKKKRKKSRGAGNEKGKDQRMGRRKKGRRKGKYHFGRRSKQGGV